MDLETIESNETEIILDTEEKQQRRAWALQNPRDLTECLALLETLSTSSVKAATSSYYCLKQGEKFIYGLSVGFTETVLHCFPNIAIYSKIDKLDKLKGRVTISCTAEDFQNNTSFQITVTQKLFGKKLSESDYNMAIRACRSIGFRDAILKILPRIYTDPILDKIKTKAMSEATLEYRWNELKAILLFDFGISEDQILRSLNTTVDDMTPEHLITLSGFKQSLDDKHAVPTDIFKQSKEETIQSNVRKSL